MSRSKELVGKRFGKLFVEEMVGVNNDNRPLYRCRCDCGNEKIVTSRRLMEGKEFSCGCDKRENLTGKQFGRWTVISKAEKRGRYYYWHCKCFCGNEKDVRERSLLEGTSMSCGCIQKEVAAKMCSETKKKDLIGERFGRLLVVENLGYKRERHGTIWRCLCDCGNEVNVVGHALKKGATVSCGCYARESQSKRAKTHGESKTRLYSIYRGMISRCYCENSGEFYKNYGGRGITVCDAWKSSYENFRDWALNNGYSDELTIDRIDVNGNYCPENCRWITMKQQARNKRKTIRLTYHGVTKSAYDWGEIIGVSGRVLDNRKRKGWSDEDCIEIPLLKNGNDKTKNERKIIYEL